jgi:hypothetical protein
MQRGRGITVALAVGALPTAFAAYQTNEPSATVVEPLAAPPAPSAAAAPAPRIELPTPEAARAVERSCTSICDRSRALKCARANDCMPDCLAMAVGTPCADEFASLYRCLVKEPDAHWECADDGVAAIREGFCEKEQEKSVSCMEAKASR